ncbi:MAG: hypothetical protein DRH34_05930 [Deltaproteobacteria bacterium]|nr:MAG: hypothetical protein DRH34_05930 [Deltaproteobacteria bacterium]
MSDPTIEEESLISQDDIDKLLDSSSIEEAEDKLSGDDNKSVDELGELSQDDIDQLMNSNVTVPEDSLNDDDSEDDDMELISQDDIDQLMNSGASSKEDIEEPLDEVNDSSGEDVGELSQDDIDQLMNSNVTVSEDSLNDQTEDAEVENETPDDEEESKEEDAPSSEAVTNDQTTEPVNEDNRQEDKYVIDESEAMDVQDCLISQETIDDLIENLDNDAQPEAVILDEEPVPDTQRQAEPESESAVDPAAISDEQNVQEDAVLDDTEDFLKPDSDITVLDFDSDEDEDVSQEDIDALLLESDDEDDEDDILISQDDIDTLLMAADQEDEDVLGDLADNEFDGSFDDDIEDEDIEDEDMLENDEFESEDEAYDEDQVVLEGDDEEPVTKPKKKKVKAGSQWYKSKLVIACASALIILGITVPLTYFIFFSGEETQDNPIARLSVETQREIEIETVDVHVRESVNKPGNMILKDFVILASDLSKDMAYITADISIDYSDQRAYHEIQNNLSFYRDLIYDSINKSFVSEKRDEITEADILWIVETTLKKVLPGHYIARVSFKSFKAS